MIKKKKLSYFFFQAEDGIRVLYVTGVQTCALPIYHLAPLVERDLEERAHLERRVQPGVVDEDVDGAAAAHDLLDQLADRLLVGDIGREPETAAICRRRVLGAAQVDDHDGCPVCCEPVCDRPPEDRKSTRLNSSHVEISYA